jgi:hypothetical protein
MALAEALKDLLDAVHDPKMGEMPKLQSVARVGGNELTIQTEDGKIVRFWLHPTLGTAGVASSLGGGRRGDAACRVVLLAALHQEPKVVGPTLFVAILEMLGSPPRTKRAPSALRIGLVGVHGTIDAGFGGLAVRAYRLGEAMEAQGSHSLAARVYTAAARQASAHDLVSPFSDQHIDGSTLLLAAGIAHRRATEYRDAERCYVHALDAGGRHVRHIWDAMVTLYLCWGQLGMYTALSRLVEDSQKGARRRMAEACNALDVLARGATEVGAGLPSTTPKRSRRRGARLRSQLPLTQVGEFRRKVLGHLNPDEEYCIAHSAPSATQDLEDAIRQLDANARAISRSLSPCEVCGADAAHKCPCNTTRYCSKTCQKSHWKEHKLCCPARASASPQ